MDRAQDSGAPPDVYNRLVTRYNDLSDRMRELDLELRDLAKRSKTLSENAAKQREQFVQSLLDLRSIADKIQGQYAALARDPDVKAALAALNTNRKTQAEITLGPSNTFLQGLKNLAKFEKAVLTESVDLRGDRGVFWVDAVLNQNHPKPMLVDTGAALVILPADLASEIGIRSKTGDRSIQLKLADGRTVEARMARMKALRVGKFSAENVECAVLPEGLEEAVPLLGQTFLQRFSYRIDTDARKLTLWKLDLPTEEGGLGRKVEPRRGRG
jgi:clan AA aspartic protease (TIGR02281 family)